MRKKYTVWLVIGLGLLVGVCIAPMWLIDAYQAVKGAAPVAVQPFEQKLFHEFMEPYFLGTLLIEDLEGTSGAVHSRISSYYTQKFRKKFTSLFKEWKNIKDKKGNFISIENLESVSYILINKSKNEDINNIRAAVYTLRFERGVAYLGIVVVRYDGKWYIESAHIYSEKPIGIQE